MLKIASLLFEPSATAKLKGELDQSDTSTENIFQFLSEGADINTKGEVDGTTALIFFIEAGDLDSVRILVETYKADVNLRDHYNFFPCYYAFFHDHENIFKYLAAHGADINATLSDGLTILHSAVDFGKKDFVETLIALGANVDAKNKLGNTPLHSAIYSNNIEIVKLLLLANASTNIKNNNGLHASLYISNLDKAITKQQEQIKLAEQQEQINQKNKKKKSSDKVTTWLDQIKADEDMGYKSATIVPRTISSIAEIIKEKHSAGIKNLHSEIILFAGQKDNYQKL